jgi:hypothetical protein
VKSVKRIGLSSVLAVAFLLIFMAVPAAAVNANVTSKGSFSNPVGDGAGSVLVCGPNPRCPSGPESQIRWGQSTGSGTSGLGFQGTSTVVSNENPFSVGTLSHFNNPTADGTQIDGVLLTVAVNVTTAGGSFGLSVPTSLAIDNTNNAGPCPYPSNTPCSDAITIVSLGSELSSTAVLGDTSFTLTILGFQNSSGQLVTQFISQEGGTNSVRLFATLEQKTRPVADAGADQTVEQTGTLTDVTLDGSASSDPDGDALTYTWTGDGLSGSVSGASPTVQLPAGSHTLTLTVSDGELTATDTVQVTVQDTINPTIAGSRTPAANADGWNNTDVTVSFDCDDSGSGVAGCTGSTTLTADGAGQSVTGTAADNAGNTAEATVGGINIDQTGPSIVFGGNAGTYTLDQSVVITCMATDALSGISTSDCPEVTSPAAALGVGTHTLTAMATDRAGNTITETTTFRIVVTYEALCGLVEQYVDSAGVANSLCAKLRAAEAAAGRGEASTAANLITAFKNEVAAQTGRSMTAQEAATLALLADHL